MYAYKIKKELNLKCRVFFIVFFPDFQISRCLGQLIVGNVFGQLVLMSIPGPEDLNGLNLLLLADLLAPMAIALGKNLICIILICIH